MTSQPPAPKASSAAALLASLPTNSPKITQSASADFLSVILQALSPKTKNEGETTAAKEQDAQKDKSTTANTKTGTDATDSSGLLLTLLAMSAPPLPPLPKMPKLAPRKTEAEPVKGSQAPAPSLNSKEDVGAQDSKGDSLAKKLTPVDLKAKPEISPETVSGTSAATNGQRMSFAAQKNEVAGAAEQKLPLISATSVASVTAVEAAAAPGQDGSKKSLDLSWRETPPEMVAMVNLAAKPAEASAETATISTAASPADRLEKMISQEVVTIRQTGAQTLGVSLKLDDNTQLFLQLTTQNGQIQASLRCEKGTFSALDSQWSQLQESLARQNVQLTPAAGASSFNFQQSSQQQQQQQRNLPQQWEEWRQANPAVPPAQSLQQKNQNARRSRTDWESWA